MQNCNFGIHSHKPLVDDHHDHAHHHEHHHEEEEHHHHHRVTDKKVLKLALFITFVTMILEFVAGFLANSLALISDAIHMFTHSFALIISLVAIIIASKKAPLDKTFGYYRIEVIAALLNGITIVFSIFWIIYEAVMRFLNPAIIDLKISMIVAFIGLVVNIITGLILMQGNHENINLKSAFVHMLADALSSIAIIIGYIIIAYTNYYFIDILLALLVSFVIGKWAYSILKASINTLLESSPLEIGKVKEFLESFDEIIEAHDIHIWEITGEMFNLTAHLKIDESSLPLYHDLIHKLNHELEHHYKIAHTTFQIEWDK